MVAEEIDHQKVQIKLPVNVWRKARSEAALRGLQAQDLVARALMQYLGMETDEGRGKPTARAS